MQECLNLANLPSDIIRKIIMIGNESILAMRLISQRWNRLANRSCYPVIKMITLFQDGKNWNVSIRMYRRHREYFNLLINLPTWYDHQKPNEIVANIHSLNRSSEHKQMLMKFISQVCRKCSRIEILRLEYSEISILNNLLHKVEVDHLVLAGNLHFDNAVQKVINSEYHQYAYWWRPLVLVAKKFEGWIFGESSNSFELLKLIKCHTVQRMTLYFKGSDWTSSEYALRDFLSEAINQVKSIQIWVCTSTKDEMHMDDIQRLACWKAKVDDLNHNANFIAKLGEITQSTTTISIEVKALEKNK